MIVTTEAAQQAKAVTTTVPIVMVATTTDPVEAGLIDSLARPGGNITGLTISVGPEIDAKRIALLKETLPGATRVAYLGTNEDWENPWGEECAGRDFVHVASGTPEEVRQVHAIGHERTEIYGFAVEVRVRQPALSREIDDEPPVSKLVRSGGDEQSISATA